MPAPMSSRERCLRAIRGEPTDRVPIRLWGVDPLVPAPRPEWRPLSDLALEFDLDSILHFSAEWPAPTVETTYEERDTTNPEWYEQTATTRTPAGDLTSVQRLHRGRSEER